MLVQRWVAALSQHTAVVCNTAQTTGEQPLDFRPLCCLGPPIKTEPEVGGRKGHRLVPAQCSLGATLRTQCSASMSQSTHKLTRGKQESADAGASSTQRENIQLVVSPNQNVSWVRLGAGVGMRQRCSLLHAAPGSIALCSARLYPSILGPTASQNGFPTVCSMVPLRSQPVSGIYRSSIHRL